jgi:hypothetical protein
VSNDKTSLGKISLWASLLGAFVIPFSFCIVFAIVYPKANSAGGRGGADVLTPLIGFGIGGALFFLLELLALGCGIVARHTTTGKTGLTIAGVLLALFILLIGGYFFLRYLPW